MIGGGRAAAPPPLRRSPGCCACGRPTSGSPLAEDDLVVPLRQHVLGGHQELLHRRSHSALRAPAGAPGRRDGGARSSDAAGADLDHVAVLGHELERALVQRLLDHRIPTSRRRCGGSRAPARRAPGTRRRGAGLERSAAQNCARRGAPPARWSGSVPASPRSTAPQTRRSCAAHRDPAHHHDPILRSASRLTSLYGCETGMTSSTPGRLSKRAGSTAPVAGDPHRDRVGARDRVSLQAERGDRADDRLLCCGLAPAVNENENPRSLKRGRKTSGGRKAL